MRGVVLPRHGMCGRVVNHEGGPLVFIGGYAPLRRATEIMGWVAGGASYRFLICIYLDIQTKSNMPYYNSSMFS